MEDHIVAVLVSTGVFIVGLATLFITTTSKYLSIREYETYISFIKRELDNVLRRLDILEQTRPTTGELEAKLGVKGANTRCKD